MLHMVGEMYIMKNNVGILIFCFALSACTIQKNSVEGTYISHIDSHSTAPDSLVVYKDKSFKLNYNSYGHPLPNVLYGNWARCGNRLFLIPENFVRKVVEERDTSLNDSIAISVYDHELDHYRFQTNFSCYIMGEAVEMSHEATSENHFKYDFVIHHNSCDSIKVKADDYLNDKEEYRPMIIPKPNTRYKVHSRYTGTGFFIDRNFYFRKRGKYIYIRWNEELIRRWKRESNGKVSKGYLWLEKEK